MQLTAIIEKSDSGWYVGQIREVPSALSQGRTLQELRENIVDALQLVFRTNREFVKAEHAGKAVIQELIVLPE